MTKFVREKPRVINMVLGRDPVIDIFGGKGYWER